MFHLSPPHSSLHAPSIYLVSALEFRDIPGQVELTTGDVALFILHREKSSREKRKGQFPAILVNLLGAEKDAGSKRARSVRGNGIAVRQMSWNVGGERGLSGNLAHFVAAIHQLK